VGGGGGVTLGTLCGANLVTLRQKKRPMRTANSAVRFSIPFKQQNLSLQTRADTVEVTCGMGQKRGSSPSLLLLIQDLEGPCA
jgi:hypothetical protein